MGLTVWQDLGVEQFREVALRLASVIQSSVDKPAALNKLIDAADSGETFTDLLIEHSARWFHETGGQSILVGPELFWLLSEPTPKKVLNGGARGQEIIAEQEHTVSHRSRKLLVVCVLETLAQNQWVTNGIGEPYAVNGIS
ncbi:MULTISPECIES: hypothetical protein [unclassified Nocardia]|uniref:hypothetical protein n=1 Tax=unclassified Nocardia TaxID=2637762 RepID=UPI001CE3F7CB|nr:MULTISPECIES: hypothetical protein [unclassified Nocardia]